MFRTPSKGRTQTLDLSGTPEEVGFLDDSPIQITSPPVPSRPRKPKKPKNFATEKSPSPKKRPSYASRTAEAKALLTKAKIHLGNSRNLKSDIKAEVTGAIERLYQLVKEAEAEQNGAGALKEPNEKQPECNEPQGELARKIEQHSRLLTENAEQMQELKMALAKNTTLLANPPSSYASVTALASKPKPVQPALHSIIVSSDDVLETGEEVLERVRKAVDAKEGWIRVEKVRKAKDARIVLGCPTVEDRDKARERLEAGRLRVEDVRNRDPMIVLRDLLNINSDEEVLQALRKQNREVFDGLGAEDDRIQVRFRKRARNPHTSHLVLSVSPIIWRRATELGALRVDLQRVRVLDQSPLVQCSRCLAYGHTKRYCTEEADVCSHCGGPHLKAACEMLSVNVTPTCKNCIRAKIDRTDHNAFSEDCLVRKRWESLARSSVAYC